MVTAASAAGFVDLCAAFIALYIFPLLDPQQGAHPSAQVALLDSAVEMLVPLAALGVLASASMAIYRHLQHAAAVAGAAGTTRRLYRLFAVLCASVGILEFVCFVYPAGVGGDVGAQARALGVAAARVLPAAAAATFFLGVLLIIVAHVRAGGEGGGGGDFAADGGHIQEAVSFLTKAAYAAAAALAWLVVIALCADADNAIY